MAPKKRTSLGGKRKADDAGLKDEVETVLEVGEGHAACAPVMAKLDEVIRGGSTVEAYLATRLGTPRKRTEFAEWLAENIPPEGGVQYATAMENGASVMLRPSMLSHETMHGQKGFLVQDETKHLIALMLTKGCLSDGAKLANVEKLSVEAIRGQKLEHPQDAQWIGMGSISYIKGWSRAQSLLFILNALKDLNLAGDVPLHIRVSYATVHGVVTVCESEEMRAHLHRVATLGSTATRRRPNCFNYLFQARKILAATGQCAVSVLSKWAQSTALSAALSMTKDEAAACSNLVMNVPDHVICRMQALVAKYGMTKRGALTHGMLASEWVAMGGGGGMPNSEETLTMLVDRLESDYEMAPHQLRRPATLPELAALQQRCFCFHHALGKLQGMVPDCVFEPEQGLLRQKFQMRYLDMELDEVRSDPPGLMDVEKINSFKSILAQSRGSAQAEMRAKHKEITDRVAQATFHQLQMELQSDAADAAAYLAQRSAHARGAESADLAYTQLRYNKGPSRVLGLGFQVWGSGFRFRVKGSG